jgi:hypothetical protein
MDQVSRRYTHSISLDHEVSYGSIAIIERRTSKV